MRTLPPPLLLLSLLLAGCASTSPPSVPAPSAASNDDVPAGGGRVSIENHSSSDMDIYVLRRGTAVRLGFAPAEAATSDSFTFQPGAELHWVVPA